MSGPIVHAVQIGGIPYRLCYKFGSLRLFERELGKTLAEALPLTIENAAVLSDAEIEAELTARAGKIPLEVWSALWWAVLQPHHMMTRDASDSLIDEAGPDMVVRWLLGGTAAYSAGDPALLQIAEQSQAALGNGQRATKAKPKARKTSSS